MSITHTTALDRTERMMISSLIAVALGLTTPPLPVTAEDPMQGTTEAKAEAAAEAKKVCRRITSTGTRLPKRVCRTQAEWDSDADQVKRDIRTGPGNGARGENARNSF
ncbi:hypothetical protein [Sphingomonas koreensis]|uniref:hypothetical protein n=1 Tax=Sphingomonas koreensis TaxID=93064 RepID=UPI000F7F6F9E|nr:hypothetical protein [Sphingomonas koreensis]